MMKIVIVYSFFFRNARCHVTYICSLRYKTYVNIIIIISIDQSINQSM